MSGAFDVTVASASLATANIIAGLAVVFWAVRALAAKRSARASALVVEIAAHAPEDDGYEHEFEQRNTPRTAAPGESDCEEDVGTPRRQP